MSPNELLAEPVRISVASVLARFPVHQLVKSGGAPIEIRETAADGQVTLRWEVAPNAKFGPPGPLAYQVDTLAVNRRLDEAPRPVPGTIRLGSWSEIAELAGTSGGHTTQVQHALMQNAAAMITARVTYRDRDGVERWFEFAGTRYGVFTKGQMLPDGRKADAVYLELHSTFRALLDQAQTRPLDYDYLRELPVAAQRLYELLSYPMYAARVQFV
jgi:uncharacterized protein YodC (DUF2158 family)